MQKLLKNLWSGYGKKAFAATLAALFALLNKALNLGIDDQTVQMIVGAIVVYIFGQGIADNGKEKAKIEQETQLMLAAAATQGVGTTTSSITVEKAGPTTSITSVQG